MGFVANIFKTFAILRGKTRKVVLSPGRKQWDLGASARRLLSATLLERWPQVCRVKITCTKLPTNLFISTTKISMKYVVNWIPLRIRVRSRNTRPHLKGGPEPLKKEIHKILGSKREDRFSDPFLKLVQKISGSFFRTCFITAIYVRTRGHCESSRRSARR